MHMERQSAARKVLSRDIECSSITDNTLEVYASIHNYYEHLPRDVANIIVKPMLLNIREYGRTLKQIDRSLGVHLDYCNECGKRYDIIDMQMSKVIVGFDESAAVEKDMIDRLVEDRAAGPDTIKEEDWYDT